MAIDFHHVLKEQAAAFREAAIRAGRDASVATCEGWNVAKLVRHLARVYAMTGLSLDLGPDDAPPRTPRPPEDFDEALAWFDDQLAEMDGKLSAADPSRPVWAFFPGGTASSWLRRMAHETAIHRLDAEHALAGLDPDRVHPLIFDSEFAADGVDEVLSVLLGRIRDWKQQEHEGHVLYHAADAGRTWLVTYRPGRLPEVGSPHDSALGSPEVDATVAGTADAVYRRVWGRPSHAAVTGDRTLAGLITGY